jgi:thiol-disulfide isomerase/thioredoxin
MITTGMLMSCNNKERITGGFSTIKGTYGLTVPWAPREVKFSKIEYGKEAGSEVNDLTKTKKYGFTVPVEKEGFYVLSSDYNHIPIYLKGDQVFNVSIDKTKYIQKNIPDEENRVLYEWMQLTDTLNHYMSFSTANPATYKEFFPFYENFRHRMKAFHEKVNTSNKKFNRLMHAYIDMTIAQKALYFIYTPRSVHPKPEEIPDFYNKFGNLKVLNSNLLLELPDGMDVLRLWDMYYLANIKKINDGLDTSKPENRSEMMNRLFANLGKSIKNDTLRGFFALSQITMFQAYNKEYLNFMKRFRKDIELSDYVKKQVEEYESQIVSTGKGSPGLDFTYKDVNGKEVSFSDFRGKIVYIDVWATWCSPCKQEIPYLKKLEKDFHGKDIRFISISVDKPKDKAKWEKFVKKEHLGGVQLFADDAFDASIAKYYKINAIPRFLLFDEEGKIIDTDAPRPSDPELRKLLTNLLK